MTKRKDPKDLKIRARDDLTPVKKPKPPSQNTPEKKAARIAKLRETPTNNSAAAIAQYNPDRPLTEKMRLFAKEWASGESILSASQRAGYADSGAMAYKLAKDPAILKIYNIEKALYEQASQMTRKRVMEGLLDGIDTAKMLGEPASIINGWKTIGQMCGYFEPVKRTIDVNLTGNITVKRLESMPDSDLLKIMKGEIEDVDFEEVIEEGGKNG